MEKTTQVDQFFHNHREFSWTELPEYKKYLRKWKDRPEYKSILKKF